MRAGQAVSPQARRSSRQPAGPQVRPSARRPAGPAVSPQARRSGRQPACPQVRPSARRPAGPVVSPHARRSGRQPAGRCTIQLTMYPALYQPLLASFRRVMKCMWNKYRHPPPSCRTDYSTHLFRDTLREHCSYCAASRGYRGLSLFRTPSYLAAFIC